MKKFIFAGVAVSLIASVAVFANKTTGQNPDNAQVNQWEALAEKGDTAAMHRLIEFYDENSPVFVEVAEVIDADGYEWTEAEVDSLNAANKANDEMSEQYAERLEYWLDKGIATNDPVAIVTKGMRLYYEDESKAIAYLSKAADSGNAQAALFCGSACFNQGMGDEAFKYLSMAYESGEPSAGWHLAMCYIGGIGTESNENKAIEAMRHAAIMNYPEAVLEMRRIEPTNSVWQHKADSLGISFPDFPILPV